MLGRKARIAATALAIPVGLALSAIPAYAANGQTLKSDAVGGDATCVMHTAGAGFNVTCVLRDTKQDGNPVKISWSGPGKSGTDYDRDGNGTHANYKYTFAANSGSFTFHCSVDRSGPDSQGASKTLTTN